MSDKTLDAIYLVGFQKWQATGRYTDLNYTGEIEPGRIYEGDLYIQRGDDGDWCLTIGNDSELSDDLAALERKLYDWAVGEGYFEATP